MPSTDLPVYQLDLAAQNVLERQDVIIVGRPAYHEQLGLYFDGASGVILPFQPLHGLSAFRLKCEFQPVGGGEYEQRFLHIGHADNQRALMEIRMQEGAQWAFDTFMLNASSERTLLDESLLHPPNQWRWGEISYENECMTQLVDGQEEIHGHINWQPLNTGQLSIGMRMNQVSHYKGFVRKIEVLPS